MEPVAVCRNFKPTSQPVIYDLQMDRRPDGSVGMALVLPAADRLRVVVRIAAGPLGSLKCDPP